MAAFCQPFFLDKRRYNTVKHFFLTKFNTRSARPKFDSNWTDRDYVMIEMGEEEGETRDFLLTNT